MCYLIFQGREDISLLVPSYLTSPSHGRISKHLLESPPQYQRALQPKVKRIGPSKAHPPISPKAHSLISHSSHPSHAPTSPSQPATPTHCDLMEIQENEQNFSFSLSPCSPTNPLLDSNRSKLKPDTKEKQKESEGCDPTIEFDQIDPFDPLLLSQTKTFSASQTLLPVQATPPRKKGKQIATRRSQRLQEKGMPTHTPPKPVIKPKTAIASIPFLPISQHTPIEAEATLQILQATGLKITQQVEVLIQEAIKLDQSEEATQLPRPQTPLHDIIPPRVMPDDGMIL